MSPRRHIIPVFVPHLGCPNACVFCNQRRISGQVTAQTAETVRETILAAFEKIPVGTKIEVAFYGGSFTAIPREEQENLLGAVQPFLQDGRIDSIRLSTRPDAIDPETILRLRRFGVGTVELGVQSMCEDVLRKSGRGHTAEDAVRAALLLKEAGLQVILQMMTGLPGDTPERSLETARRLCALKPDGVRIYPTVVIRDTPLFDLWLAGLYPEHTVEEAVTLCVRLVELFEAEGISVIRLGLNPTEELSGGAVAAGAYHPAFGELVYTRRYLEQARRLLQAVPAGQGVVLGVAPGQISAMVGQKRCNIRTLTEEFGLCSLKVKETEIQRGEVVILAP